MPGRSRVGGCVPAGLQAGVRAAGPPAAAAARATAAAARPRQRHAAAAMMTSSNLLTRLPTEGRPRACPTGDVIRCDDIISY